MKNFEKYTLWLSISFLMGYIISLLFQITYGKFIHDDPLVFLIILINVIIVSKAITEKIKL